MVETHLIGGTGISLNSMVCRQGCLSPLGQSEKLECSLVSARNQRRSLLCPKCCHGGGKGDRDMSWPSRIRINIFAAPSMCVLYHGTCAHTRTASNSSYATDCTLPNVLRRSVDIVRPSNLNLSRYLYDALNHPLNYCWRLGANGANIKRGATAIRTC